jgi:hypothetical protein
MQKRTTQLSQNCLALKVKAKLYNQQIKKEALKAYQSDQKYRECLVQVLVE